MRDWLSLHWFNRVSLLTCLLCKVTSQYTGNGFGSICGCCWNSLWSSSQSGLEVKNKNKPHICLTMYAFFHCCNVQFRDEQSLAVGKKKHKQAFTTIPQTLGKPTYKPSWNSSLTLRIGLEQPVQKGEVSSQSQNKAVILAGWQSSSTSHVPVCQTRRHPHSRAAEQPLRNAEWDVWPMSGNQYQINRSQKKE